jgi:transposase-like protein
MASRRPKAVHQLSSAQFDKMFPIGDDDAPRAYLKARRWPDGVRCPRCGNPAVYDLPSRKWHWQCPKCAPGGSEGYRFSILVGTIFENTNKPLRDWFKLAHLMLTSKKGMSARQLYRYMGFGSVKTAWIMAHKIRLALVEQNPDKLGGIVEVDETWIGGKDYWKHSTKKSGGRGGGGSGKVPVIGAVQRKGNVVARVLDHVTSINAQAFVREMVSNKVSLLATDESSVYDGLTEYPRGAVEHRRKQYVVGAIHTNTIEGFWSIFKRGVVGTFHKVSEKYLPLYVAEFQFRYNNRGNSDIFGAAISKC